jgi:hypothetical protein
MVGENSIKQTSTFNSRSPTSRGCDTHRDPCHMLLRSALIATARRSLLPATPLRFLAVMAPKRKRKVAEESPPPTKRVKKTDTVNSQMSVASASSSQIDSSGQPTNTQLPDEISFPGNIPGTRRISAWNVCGWAASNKKVRSPDNNSVFTEVD